MRQPIGGVRARRQTADRPRLPTRSSGCACCRGGLRRAEAMAFKAYASAWSAEATAAFAARVGSVATTLRAIGSAPAPAAPPVAPASPRSRPAIGPFGRFAGHRAVGILPGAVTDAVTKSSLFISRAPIPDPMLARLLPRDEQFFELFDQLAHHLATTAKTARHAVRRRRAHGRSRQGDQGHRAQGRSAHADDQPADRQELHHADRPRGHPPCSPRASTT